MLDYNAIMQAAMALSAQVDDLPAEQPQTSLPLEIPPRFRTKAMAQVLRRQGLVEQAEAIAPTHLTLTEDSPWEATSVETFSLVAQAPDLEIIWGAYIGFPWQVIRRGRLADVIHELIPLRERLRQKHGWVMDTYILRGPEMTDDAPPPKTPKNG